MGIGSSSSNVTEENPVRYDFSKAFDKSMKSQEGNYILFLFENNTGGCFEIVLYNPIFSAKSFRLLEIQDSSEAKENFRYYEIGCISLDTFKCDKSASNWTQ